MLSINTLFESFNKFNKIKVTYVKDSNNKISKINKIQVLNKFKQNYSKILNELIVKLDKEYSSFLTIKTSELKNIITPIELSIHADNSVKVEWSDNNKEKSFKGHFLSTELNSNLNGIDYISFDG